MSVLLNVNMGLCSFYIQQAELKFERKICKDFFQLHTVLMTFLFLIQFLVELEHRIDFELREGLVESRYWSAVTSHTAYWSSLDIALFLLTFMYKHDQDDTDKSNLDAIWIFDWGWGGMGKEILKRMAQNWCLTVKLQYIWHGGFRFKCMFGFFPVSKEQKWFVFKSTL